MKREESREKKKNIRGLDNIKRERNEKLIRKRNREKRIGKRKGGLKKEQ